MTFLLCFLCFVAGTLVGILLMACIAAGATADRNDPFMH
jgi:hypothetical protein